MDYIHKILVFVDLSSIVFPNAASFKEAALLIFI